MEPITIVYYGKHTTFKAAYPGTEMFVAGHACRIAYIVQYPGHLEIIDLFGLFV
jgi:hypothetical protein